MPRPRKPGSGEPKTRSRHGCKQCKARKIKCGEQKPTCINCEKTAQLCDYSIKLNWEARTKRKSGIQNHMTIGQMGQVMEMKEASPNGSPIKEEQPAFTAHDSMHQLDPSPSFVSRGNTVPVRQGSGDFYGSVAKYAQLGDDGTPYPSPVDSDGNTASSSKRPSFTSFQQYGEMPPPAQLSPRGSFGGSFYFDNGYNNKRTKLSPTGILTSHYQNFADGNVGGRVPQSGQSSITLPAQSYSPPNSARVPPSPIASSIASDESQQSKTRISSQPQPDRRMSIESLISGSRTASTAEGGLSGVISLPSQSSTPKSYYGVDPGYPDFDIPFNHDSKALDDANPTVNACPKPLTPAGVKRKFGPGPYSALYKAPIKVRIPEELEPLPPILLKDPINLLYFHHFISHTARILVPHDCAGNPFRKILPKMALKDDNLLRLLLAYSASHRARLIKYPEPGTRISHYVEGMFQTLSEALHNPHTQISNSTFATSLILASLEIISPNAFSAMNPIPWDMHLNMAGEIIKQRGIHAQTVDRGDDESYFLTRWYAYLDVMGSLSGGRTNLPLFGGDFWALDPENPDQRHRIDCFFGFTDRCVCILASIAALTKEADEERKTHRLKSKFNKPFKPSTNIETKAAEIQKDLMQSMQQPYQGCNHTRRRASSPGPPDDYTPPRNENANTANTNATSTTHALELTTTNESYHWAGMIYLTRRVLGRSPSDPQLQTYVHIIVAGLGKIQPAGTAEACMLFPMFVAGCEALPGHNREKLKERLKSVEETGLTQAQKAREVMERVWKARDEGIEDVGWEGLVGEDFIVC